MKKQIYYMRRLFLFIPFLCLFSCAQKQAISETKISNNIYYYVSTGEDTYGQISGTLSHDNMIYFNGDKLYYHKRFTGYYHNFATIEYLFMIQSDILLVSLKYNYEAYRDDGSIYQTSSYLNQAIDSGEIINYGKFGFVRDGYLLIGSNNYLYTTEEFAQKCDFATV